MKTGRVASTLTGTVLGAIAGLGVVGFNSAIGQKSRNVARPPIDGWQLVSSYNAQAWPAMKFSLKVGNTQPRNRDTQFEIKLERVEFKGDFASRVIRPTDYVRTVLETQRLDSPVPGSGEKTFDVAFKALPDMPTATMPGTPRISYQMLVCIDGKPVTGATAVKPSPSGPNSPRG